MLTIIMTYVKYRKPKKATDSRVIMYKNDGQIKTPIDDLWCAVYKSNVVWSRCEYAHHRRIAAIEPPDDIQDKVQLRDKVICIVQFMLPTLETKYESSLWYGFL